MTVKIYTKAHIFITTVKTLGPSRRIETNWEAARWMLSLRSGGAEDGTYLRDTSPWFSFNLHFWKITLYIRNFYCTPCNNVMYHQGHMYPRLGTTAVGHLICFCTRFVHKTHIQYNIIKPPSIKQLLISLPFEKNWI